MSDETNVPTTPTPEEATPVAPEETKVEEEVKKEETPEAPTQA